MHKWWCTGTQEPETKDGIIMKPELEVLVLENLISVRFISISSIHYGHFWFSTESSLLVIPARFRSRKFSHWLCAQNFPASDRRFSLCKQHTVQFKAKDPPYNARFSTVPLTALFIYSLKETMEKGIESFPQPLVFKSLYLNNPML